MSFRSTFSHSIAHTIQLHMYMARFHLLIWPLLLSPCTPLCSPCTPPLLTWHPPVVIGIVHLPLRLLVNWPRLPHPPPVDPPFPNSQNPTCPAPNNDDLGNIPALAIRNNDDRFSFRNCIFWENNFYHLELLFAKMKQNPLHWSN